MDPQRWQRVKSLLGDALELNPHERAGFLERSCGGDPQLRSEIEELLEAHDRPDNFFEARTAPSASEPEQPFPAVVSHYQLQERVGTGGMGVVYKAKDLRLERSVALKFLSRDLLDNREAEIRFQREAKAASALDHPNICTVHEVDKTDDGILFIAMAYYGGQTLKHRLDEGVALTVAETLEIATQIARGLAAAHAQGVIHRDIKPSNVALADNGIVKILDFGVAILSDDTRLTRSGTTLGTVSYMAPERWRDGPIDGRVDLWSLGVVLHELLVGELPFSGQRYEALMYSILHEEPVSVSVPDPELEAGLNKVLHKALQKDPERRYASAESMEEDLGLLAEYVAREELESETVREKRRQRTIAQVPVAARVAIGIVALVAVIYALIAYVDRTQPGGSSFTATEPAFVTGSRPSIAVLFFSNMTGDPALDWLRSGLAEMIVTDLAQSSGLEVTGTERVFQILESMGKEHEAITSDAVILEVGARSGADLVLVGSFLRVADMYRVTIHVVDAADGSRLSSRLFDAADEVSLFPLVDEITLHLSTELSLPELTDRETQLSSMTTAVPEAFREYSEGMLLHYMGATPEAIPHLEKSVDLDPGFALALSKLSVMHAAEGHDREAMEFSSRALDNLDRLPARERLYVEGNHYSWREATYATAIDAYRRATELHPDHWSAHHNLGVLYMELELYEQAIERFELVARAVPDRVSNHWLLALAHAALGRVEDGAALLRNAINTDASAWGLFQLADYQLRVGDQAGARAALESAAPLAGGRDPRSYTWRLDILEHNWDSIKEQRGEADASGDPYERADDLLRRGLYNRYLGNPGIAGEQLEIAAGLYPEAGRASAWARVLAAQGFAEAGDLDRALRNATLAAEDGAGDVGEWNGLFYQAVLLAQRNDLDSARELAETLKEKAALVPGSKEERRYLWLLGSLALEDGDIERAISHLESARELLPPRGIGWVDWMQPPHAPIWYSLAEARVARGEPETAAELYRAIVSGTAERLHWPTRYARSLFRLGRFHQDRGEVELAAEFFRRYLVLREEGTVDRDQVRQAAEFVDSLMESRPTKPPGSGLSFQPEPRIGR